MSRKIKILIGAAIAAVILMLVSMFVNSRGRPTNTNEVPIPTKVAVPTREIIKYFSDTGAKYISPTDSAYTEDWLIGSLRDKTPITTAAFTISYDYKIDKFVVSIKDKTSANRQVFLKWIDDAGYTQVPSQYFVFQ